MLTTGIQNLVTRSPSLLGDPITRALTHMERLESTMLRGLIRSTALDRSAGLLLSEFDSLDSFGTEHRFMTELALAGEFRLVAGPTYFKRLHGKNVHLVRLAWTEEHKRIAWAGLAAWMVEVIVPAGTSLEQRWSLLYTVLDRFLVARGMLSRTRIPYGWLYGSNSRARVLLRGLLDRTRSHEKVDDWIRARRRWMLCQIDNADLGTRATLLRIIFERLRSGGRFDPLACLEVGWQALEDRVTAHFGVSGQIGK